MDILFRFNMFYFFIIILDIILVLFILKDKKYFFEEEKIKLILMVIFIPIFGGIYVLRQFRSDFGWYVAIATFLVSITLWCHSRFCLAINYFFTKTLAKIIHLL